MALASGCFYGYKLFFGDKSLYLVGETSHGHHQIEMQCEACHLEPFGQRGVLQEACVGCHAEELEAFDDSHGKSKFTDPRNAELLSVVDARKCVSCHREHRSEITGEMGVTMPDDFCFSCHSDIAEERESHAGLAFDSCAASGCHNYHDNTALYADFIHGNLKQPDTHKKPRLDSRNKLALYIKSKKVKPVKQADWSGQDENIVSQWLGSVHAKAAVNCMDCHAEKNKTAEQASAPLPVDVCKDCHQSENKGFLSGKHGMRIQQGLPPMSPALAKLPMRSDAAHRTLTCASCHDVHSVDVKKAAVDSCLECHADEHSVAYKDSPHYDLWQKSLTRNLPENAGVSCASCHMPRITESKDGVKIVHVEHNQNANLRPNEKMLRNVCMNCHGLKFSLDAMVDKELIRRNFAGKPNVKLATVEMIERYFDRKK